MRLRIVVRSLAVILASPLVALPTGQAQTPEATSELAADPTPATGPAVQLASGVSRPAAAPPSRELAAVPVPNEAADHAAPTQPVEITVACGSDGCVVQNGLDVMVVASLPAAR